MWSHVHPRAASVITATVVTLVSTSAAAQDTTGVGAISGAVMNVRAGLAGTVAITLPKVGGLEMADVVSLRSR